MLSVQSLQTLRGAAAVDFCRYSRVAGAIYRSTVLPELRVLARAQLCQLAACRSRAAELGLASPQRSRAAWIAQLCSAFNDAV